MRIHLRKTGAMQAMLTAVARGYHWHVSGQVAAERAGPLIAKFTERYEIGLPWWTIARRRQQGRANARHPACDQERLGDARERRQRLVFQTQFEAVRRPAPGGQPRWTWRIAQGSYDDFAARLREAISHRNDDRDLKALIVALHRLPGFRGVRNQVAALRTLTLAEWGRCRGDKECGLLPKAVQPFERFGAVNAEMVEIFRLAVLGRLNVLVSGGTGSGKTTPLRCFCRFVPEDERTITVEDTAENLLPDHPHRLSFEAPKRRHGEGAVAVTMGLLIENALRQRPDRIIVGEIRSAEAAAAFVDAINTGHAGTMSTVHANGAVDALVRLDVLYARQAANFSIEVVRALIRANNDLVVQAVREPDGEAGAVRRVKEVVWIEDRQPVAVIRHRRGEGHVGDAEAITRFRRRLADRVG